MAKKKARRPAEIQVDRKKIVKYLRRGWTQTQIALELGLHPVTVNREWKLIREEFKNELKEDHEGILDQKLEELSEIKLEAWSAWEKSKEDAIKRTEETNERGGRSSETVEGQCGDPRFLLVVKQCIDRECELLGLNPEKEIRMKHEVIKWDTLYKNATQIAERVNPVTAQLKQLTENLVVKQGKPEGTTVIDGKVDKPS